MNKLFLILGVLILSACSQVTKPIPFGLYRGMQDGAPPGTESFRKGFKDGCESGLAAYGSLHYKAAYDYTYDDSLIQNDEYHGAWTIGFRHCRWYTSPRKEKIDRW